MDRVLTVKLLAIVVIFLVSLFFYENILFIEPYVYSYYPLSSIIICAVSLGMIFSVVVYNFAIFFYAKDKQHLFYALAQLSVLYFLVTLESLFISPFNSVYGLDSLLLHSLSQLSILIFSMLFIREFLHTKEIRELDFLIKIVIYLALIDIVTVFIFGQNIITTLIPIFIPIWLIVSESNRLIKDKQVPYYLFYIGWSIVIVVSILVYTRVTTIINDSFPFLHIAFGIESILLSLALTYKVKLLQDEKDASQTLLLQQSRLASMGEMIASIAHQWKQPLTHLGLILMNIKKSIDKPKVIDTKLVEAQNQLSYMSQTIDAFRSFYNPSKKKEEFDIKDACKSALFILSHSLKSEEILVEIEELKPFSFYANKNEFEQVILNLINNSIATFMEREIKNPYIKITIDKPTVTILDNGGGIDKGYREKIFEPYFSTKKNSDGIGLYIVKTIIEKEMKGKLSLVIDGKNTIFKIYL